jgi:cyclopropane-fatty-acyl-phospholipid synthase
MAGIRLWFCSSRTRSTVFDAVRLSDVASPFSIELPDGDHRNVGKGNPEFQIRLRNQRAVRALLSFDEATIAQAYLHGDIDFEGDMLMALAWGAEFEDRHPLGTAVHFVWRLLLGDFYANVRAVALPHADPNLILRFLDPVMPTYAQGAYASDEEPLAKALERKFDCVMTKCELGPGKKVLEIEPSWGTFAAYALKAGVNFTGITISDVSQSPLKSKFGNFGDRFKILVSNILNYETDEQFDVIVAMGTLPHPTQDERLLRKFSQLLKPGGRVFLEEAMVLRPYEAFAFMARPLFPRSRSPHVIGDVLETIARTKLELIEVHNDRWNCHLTVRQWAKNLESNKDYVQRTFGDYEYRKFRLGLWRAAYKLRAGNLDRYRLILCKPTNNILNQLGKAILITRDGVRRSI